MVDRHPYLSNQINDALQEQDTAPSLDFRTLAIGTVIRVRTKHSVYTMRIVGPTDETRGTPVTLIGGSKFVDETMGYFHGTSFGSMLRGDILTEGFSMEIGAQNQSWNTSRVVAWEIVTKGAP